MRQNIALPLLCVFGVVLGNVIGERQLTTSTLIPSTVFDSYSTFETYFSYLYPWGSDHNGAARMIGNSSFHEFIFLEDTPVSSTDDTAVPTLNLLVCPSVSYLSSFQNLKRC